MLSSISPVGEAARRQPYVVTVVAYLLGSAAGGVAVGGLAGAVGAVGLGWLGDRAALWAFGVLAVAGLLLDLTRGVPSIYRQVDESWLSRYRGWVYGVGFGAQLGAGVATVVPSSAVYLTWAAAALTRNPLGGALVGFVFGLARGLPLLVGAGVRTPAALARLMARVERLRHPADLSTRAGQALVAVLAIGLAVQ